MNGSAEKIAILVKKMISMHLDIRISKILVLGIGKNVNGEFHYDTDTIDLLRELQEYEIKTFVYDPYPYQSIYLR